MTTKSLLFEFTVWCAGRLLVMFNGVFPAAIRWHYVWSQQKTYLVSWFHGVKTYSWKMSDYPTFDARGSGSTTLHCWVTLCNTWLRVELVLGNSLEIVIFLQLFQSVLIFSLSRNDLHWSLVSGLLCIALLSLRSCPFFRLGQLDLLCLCISASTISMFEMSDMIGGRRNRNVWTGFEWLARSRDCCCIRLHENASELIKHSL